MIFSQLLDIVLNKQKLPEAEYSFFLQSNEDQSTFPVSMDTPVRSAIIDKKVILKTSPFVVIVKHLGLQCTVKINPKDTSFNVLEKFAAEVNEMVDNSISLSFEGKRASEKDTMEELGVIAACLKNLNTDESDIHDIELCGAIKVWIEDNKAGNNTPIEIFPYETIEEVMRKYCSAQSRNFILGSQLFFDDIELNEYQLVSDVKPAIQDDISLSYKAKDYEIEIKDSVVENELDANNRIMQRVEDHWTVKRLRKEYSSRVEIENISEKDSFFLEETMLHNEVQLYRLGLSPESVVYLRRAKGEDFNLYNCAGFDF